MKWHEVVTGTFLILVPIGFNVAFFSLGRTFDYPDILRRPTDEILRRFHAGGTALIRAGSCCSSARSRCCRSSPRCR